MSEDTSSRLLDSVSPKCDICKAVAEYDAKLPMGLWGYLCQICFTELGCKLGLGKGQRLVRQIRA